MIERLIKQKIITGLKSIPIVALLGPRQVGKTTLAFQISGEFSKKKTSYLALELDTDINKLQGPESYLKRFENVF